VTYNIFNGYRYESLPFGGVDQPPFLNAACVLETTLTPQSLLRQVKEIEEEIGRTKSMKRWGPREIDIDILFYG
jgi:2-amino-4-hydroxy-6-hydroxymethyldihydropteridine diphosphokinase